MNRPGTLLKAAAAVVLSTCLYPALPAFGQAAPPAGARAVPEAKFGGVGLSDAIDFIRDVSGANITVNWKALGEAGVTPETPVSLRLHNVTVRKVLTALLNEAGGNGSLTFVVDEGVIEITTQQIADARLITKVYPIDDLLVEIPDFNNAPDFNLQQQGARGSSGGGGGGGGSSGGGGQGLFGNSGSTKEKEPTKTKEERGKDIVDLITSTIRPDVWRDNGGTASIRYFNGSLIVSAPASVHEQLGS